MKDDLIKLPSIVVPRDVGELLVELSKQKKIPIASLIQIALDNEITCGNPFDFDFPAPTQPYIEDAYAEEGQAMFKFMLGWPQGIQLELFVMCRRMMGIESKEKFALALREALKVGRLIQTNTRPLGSYFLNNFGPETVWIKLPQETRDYIDKQRKDLEKKKQEVEKRKEKLKPYTPPTKGWLNE